MLEEVVDMTKAVVSVETLVTNDDSTLRSYCRVLKNCGKLREGGY